MGPIQLKNGFYIEVCNKGSSTGIKIHSSTKEGMEDSRNRYAAYAYKAVTVLGEYIDGIPQRDLPQSGPKREIPISTHDLNNTVQDNGEVKLLIYRNDLPEITTT